MSPDALTTLAGQVIDVFAHRFVVRTPTGTVLADLGPKGAERVTVRPGDQIEVSGEMRPSELKVHRIAGAGEQPVVIAQGKPRPDRHGGPEPRGCREHAAADPGPALRTAEANGFAVLGVPRRKPKHFEILGRDRAGDLVELHVGLDGALRRSKPVAEEDAGWREEIARGSGRPPG